MHVRPIWAADTIEATNIPKPLFTPLPPHARHSSRNRARASERARAESLQYSTVLLKAHVTLLQTTRKMALSLTPSPLRALAPGRAMEGQAGTASAPAPPRRSTRCPCVMRSGFPPSDEDEGGGARDCHG